MTVGLEARVEGILHVAQQRIGPLQGPPSTARCGQIEGFKALIPFAHCSGFSSAVGPR